MIHSIFNQLAVKILIQLHLLRLGQKKVVLFLETGQGKNFLLIICSHSQICIRIYIFNFKKQTSKKKQNKARIQKEQKKLKEKDDISGKLIKK